jgi:hypothetical protein
MKANFQSLISLREGRYDYTPRMPINLVTPLDQSQGFSILTSNICSFPIYTMQVSLEHNTIQRGRQNSFQFWPLI